MSEEMKAYMEAFAKAVIAEHTEASKRQVFLETGHYPTDEEWEIACKESKDQQNIKNSQS